MEETPAPLQAQAQPSEGGRSASGEASGQEADELEGIDPEYLAALPPELQAEVLEQQRSHRRQTVRCAGVDCDGSPGLGCRVSTDR